jgi:DNA-binding GntR family transcriptional regulator
MMPTSILGASRRRRSDDDSLAGHAYRAIKEKIVSLTLPPAAVVDENALSAELAVGLTPVRQALRRLEQENLVVILPRRGTMVADLNFSDLQKIFEMRLELESLTARLAAQRASREALSAMTDLLATAPVLVAAGDNARLIELDRTFHALVARAAQNEFLEQTLDWLYCHVLRLWHLSIAQMAVIDAAIDELQAIDRAIRSGDEDCAAELMRTHVRHFQDEFSKTF